MHPTCSSAASPTHPPAFLGILNAYLLVWIQVRFPSAGKFPSFSSPSSPPPIVLRLLFSCDNRLLFPSYLALCQLPRAWAILRAGGIRRERGGEAEGRRDIIRYILRTYVFSFFLDTRYYEYLNEVICLPLLLFPSKLKCKTKLSASLQMPKSLSFTSKVLYRISGFVKRALFSHLDFSSLPSLYRVYLFSMSLSAILIFFSIWTLSVVLYHQQGQLPTALWSGESNPTNNTLLISFLLSFSSEILIRRTD